MPYFLQDDYLGPSAGCTAVCAVVRNGELYVANAGDSRCVLCRGGTAVEMTQDHKPMDEEEYARIMKVHGRAGLSYCMGGTAACCKRRLDAPFADFVTCPPCRREGSWLTAVSTAA